MIVRTILTKFSFQFLIFFHFPNTHFNNPERKGKKLQFQKIDEFQENPDKKIERSIIDGYLVGAGGEGRSWTGKGSDRTHRRRSGGVWAATTAEVAART